MKILQRARRNEYLTKTFFLIHLTTENTERPKSRDSSTLQNIIPLHLAAQQGHIAVVGMLLSRSTQQQHAKVSERFLARLRPRSEWEYNKTCE